MSDKQKVAASLETYQQPYPNDIVCHKNRPPGYVGVTLDGLGFIVLPQCPT